MRQLSNITDPIHEPKSHNFIERFFLQFMKDERDLPFISLCMKIIFIVIPLAVVTFFVTGYIFWIIAGIFVFSQLYFMGPFILMLHNTSHNIFFKREYKTGNRLIPWALCPFMGQSPDTYFSHHIGMHHAENNMEHDNSSTLPFQRDSFVDFMKYFLRFLIVGIIDLVKYHRFRNKKQFVKKALVGEITFIIVAIILAYFNWKATVIVFILPLVLVRFLMMSGNWAQHAFIDHQAPENNYLNSITCVNSPYNRRCFNDGYHIGHHLRPHLHWTEMPKDFLKNKDKYAENRALVFEQVDYHQIWAMLMLKRYDALAGYVVNLNNMYSSKSEIAENDATAHEEICGFLRQTHHLPYIYPSMPSTANHIRNLISEGDLDEGLLQALQFAKEKDPQLYNDCILYQGRLKASQRDFGLGILKFEDYNITRNTISKTILDIIVSGIERLESMPEQSNIPPPPALSKIVLNDNIPAPNHPESQVESGYQLEQAKAVLNNFFNFLSQYDQGMAARQIMPLLHPSLIKSGMMKPAFRKNNFNVAHQKIRAYKIPVEISEFKNTNRNSIGTFGTRDEGMEYVYTLVRHQNQGGMPGMVRLFFSKNNNTPKITVISL